MRRTPIVVASVAASLLLVSGPAHAEEEAPAEQSKTVEIAGAVMFGAAYVPVFVMGAASTGDALGSFTVCLSPCRKPEHDGAALLIPIVGPMMYADPSARDDLLRSGPPTTAERAALYGSAALQTAGLVTLLVGVIQTTPSRRAPKSSSVPIVSPSASGVTVAGTF